MHLNLTSETERVHRNFIITSYFKYFGFYKKFSSKLSEPIFSVWYKNFLLRCPFLRTKYQLKVRVLLKVHSEFVSSSPCQSPCIERPTCVQRRAVSTAIGTISAALSKLLYLKTERNVISEIIFFNRTDR